jgi:N-acetylmuramoyl-L-alanine amidase
MPYALRPAGLACCLLAAAWPLCALGHPASRASQAASAWDHAVSLRTALEATPPEERNRESYETVLDAFRAVYHQAPSAAKAPAAVAAVAELLAEKGRVLNDPRALKSAIGQYEFLRQQYPRSEHTPNALLLEAEICRQDLKDQACASDKFHQIVAEQPGSSYAEQANLELKSMETPVATLPQAPRKTAARPAVAVAAPEAGPAAAPDAPVMPAPVMPAPIMPSPVQPVSTQPVSKAQSTPGRVVAITGMRHWSNPTSTRIAIDLGGKVEYEAARVPNPDRIFFDLHGAKLAPGLNGHTVEVVDDGYLKRIRAAQFQPETTRVVLDVTGVSEYSAFLLPNPWRLIIDIHSDPAAGKSVAAAAKPATTSESSIADVAKLSTEPAKVPATAGPTSEPVSARVPSSTADATTPTVSDAAPVDSGVMSAKSRHKGKAIASSEETVHAADPTSEGQRSLVRALGLKVGRIVIDAGHGGHDSGTLGPGGIEEKDVVLDVALRVGRLLHQRLGAEIVYTRSDDTFIPLETRTAIANKAQADLFLSIHANSSPEPSARGVEAYYLNFTSDPNALDVAARENALSSHSVHQLSDLVRKITLKDKIDESREFAADVDASLYAGLKTGNPGLHDRGVKKAPFVVLIGAQMPSILAEISFLTNPQDAQQLRDGSYRERIAESLDAGVERYLRGLSGTRPSDRSVKAAKSVSGDELAGR